MDFPRISPSIQSYSIFTEFFFWKWRIDFYDKHHFKKFVSDIDIILKETSDNSNKECHRITLIKLRTKLSLQ